MLINQGVDKLTAKLMIDLFNKIKFFYRTGLEDELLKIKNLSEDQITKLLDNFIENKSQSSLFFEIRENFPEFKIERWVSKFNLNEKEFELTQNLLETDEKYLKIALIRSIFDVPYYGHLLKKAKTIRFFCKGENAHKFLKMLNEILFDLGVLTEKYEETPQKFGSRWRLDISKPHELLNYLVIIGFCNEKKLQDLLYLLLESSFFVKFSEKITQLFSTIFKDKKAFDHEKIALRGKFYPKMLKEINKFIVYDNNKKDYFFMFKENYTSLAEIRSEIEYVQIGRQTLNFDQLLGLWNICDFLERNYYKKFLLNNGIFRLISPEFSKNVPKREIISGTIASIFQDTLEEKNIKNEIIEKEVQFLYNIFYKGLEIKKALEKMGVILND